MIGAKHPPSPRAINSIRRLVSPMQPSLPPLPLCGAARPWSFPCLHGRLAGMMAETLRDDSIPWKSQKDAGRCTRKD